ncbi:MAG: flagellar filament capping protein FliD, partial [Acidobacteriaceae bacterium]|nr:flagellar filament capping protein FliD [Acidobacteriaceae bacterium]
MASSSTSTVGTGTLSFSGLSSFSSDFQSILQRSVAIAQLPLKSLQNQDSDVLQQKQLLGSLNSAVAAVGSSISALGQLGANQALSASSSDSSLVTTQATGATSPASYTITNVQSIAKAASETSTTGYATSDSTQVSTAGNLSLVVGSSTYSITLDSDHNNLAGLRDAINNLGAGVTATILTTGSNGNYLSVSANGTGKTTLQLNDIPASGPAVNLLTSNNQGSDASFQLNGVPVTRSTNTVNDLVPGLTFTLLGTTSANQSVTLSLNSDPSQLSSALQDFATNYNALVDQVNAQVGPAAGLLNGDYLISQVEQDLQATVGYSGSNSIKGIANLGLSIDTTGKMTFDQDTFNALTPSQISDAFSFLGTSSTTGFGSLAQKFTELSDPSSGLIGIQEDGYTQQDQTLQDQIARVNDQVNSFQTSVNSKLQLADAYLAQLQSQQQVVTASVQSVDLALYGKNYGSA